MITNYQNAEIIYEGEGITGRKFNEENGCEYVQLSIDSQKEVVAHALPMPVTFYVLNGIAELKIDNEQINVQKGDLIEVKPGSSRGWKNTGNEELQLLAIKHIGGESF